MRDIYEERLQYLAKKAQQDLEEVPRYLVKTPLQKGIQLIKRNRDLVFAEDQDRKPASIILTTLAARAYANETLLIETLQSLIEEMPKWIENRDGEAWVENPTNKDENFADKWASHPDIEVAFYKWIENFGTQYRNLRGCSTTDEMVNTLGELFGEALISEITNRFSNTSKVQAKIEANHQTSTIFNVPHRQVPPWRMQLRYSVQIQAMKKSGMMKGVMPRAFGSNSHPLEKGLSLEFSAITDAPKHHSIEWQVINTGKEAKGAGQLRGDFYKSSGMQNGAWVRKESTQYKGMHCIQAFVIVNDICVARSEEFIVNIQ